MENPGFVLLCLFPAVLLQCYWKKKSHFFSFSRKRAYVWKREPRVWWLAIGIAQLVACLKRRIDGLCPGKLLSLTKAKIFRGGKWHNPIRNKKLHCIYRILIHPSSYIHTHTYTPFFFFFHGDFFIGSWKSISFKIPCTPWSACKKNLSKGFIFFPPIALFFNLCRAKSFSFDEGKRN